MVRNAKVRHYNPVKRLEKIVIFSLTGFSSDWKQKPSIEMCWLVLTGRLMTSSGCLDSGTTVTTWWSWLHPVLPAHAAPCCELTSCGNPPYWTAQHMLGGWSRSSHVLIGCGLPWQSTHWSRGCGGWHSSMRGWRFCRRGAPTWYDRRCQAGTYLKSVMRGGHERWARCMCK